MRINLNGEWNFVTDPEDSLSLESLGTVSDRRRIRVPFLGKQVLKYLNLKHLLKLD
ncbi:MAG: hypothetical protein ACUVXA_11045 [Candidatus Jordarchaeum sp.]|uniref:hypothetical protein n=1 Tax=Candidatus Jordarchaeum sp. TaxID=2823881 RepID=UPI00404B9DD9